MVNLATKTETYRETVERNWRGISRVFFGDAVDSAKNAITVSEKDGCFVLTLNTALIPADVTGEGKIKAANVIVSGLLKAGFAAEAQVPAVSSESGLPTITVTVPNEINSVLDMTREFRKMLTDAAVNLVKTKGSDSAIKLISESGLSEAIQIVVRRDLAEIIKQSLAPQTEVSRG